MSKTADTFLDVVKKLPLPKVVIAILAGIIVGILFFFEQDVVLSSELISVTESITISPTSSGVFLPNGECICYN